MKKYIAVIIIVVGFVIVLGSCQKTSNSNNATPQVTSISELSAGNETIFDESSSAFGDDFPVIDPGLEHVHDFGEVIFNEIFTPPPGYANAYYTGLGPIYNNNSCNGCHAGVGEGNPPAPGGPLVSMLFRVSGLNSNNSLTTGPDSLWGFGGQLQNNAVAGIEPEGTVNIQYTDIQGTFADGTPYTLQVPKYTVTGTYIPFPAYANISPRVAPRLVGLGYLEALSAEQIIANAGIQPPSDTSGINGLPNYVYDNSNSTSGVLGRFGWKAEQPSIKQQLCGAYKEDMGVTNSVYKVESSWTQSQYQNWVSSGANVGDPNPELPDSELYANVEYIQTLAVPAFRNGSDPQVIQGDSIFNSTGPTGLQCASCHIPTFTTPPIVTFVDPVPANQPNENAGPLLANTVIHPYTDMLLHNMGPGLSDNRNTFAAQGFQWRTPPLWGIGLLPIVDPSGQFLHDGRARTLNEAILWHGGEARTAQQNYLKLSASKRASLIAFLQSL